jgi:hypothetical protein
MNHAWLLVSVVGVAGVGLSACSALLGYDQDPPSTTSTAQGGGGGAGGPAGGNAGAGAVTTTSTGPGGTAGSAGTGGSAGGPPFDCQHALCEPGPPLVLGCDGATCVFDVCSTEPLCCSYWWAAECLSLANDSCGQACAIGPTTAFCDHLLDGNANVSSCNAGGAGCLIQDSTLGESCAALCHTLGVGCLEAWYISTVCGGVTSIGCAQSDPAQAPLCRCDLACGANPPCGNGMVCGGNECAGV